MKFLIPLSLVAAVFSAQADTCNVAQLQQPIQLMAQRAQIMQQVAATKWYNAPNHQASAYSAPQEVKVLHAARALAEEMDLNTWQLLVFVQVQMDLSKQIEAYWINYWNLPSTPSAQKPTKASILSLDVLREKIQQLDKQLYPAIDSALPAIDDCSVREMYGVYRPVFAGISGIPMVPNYGKIYLQALKSIDD